MDKDKNIQSPDIRVKIIGVGGGGVSALERLVEDNLANMELIAINTDARSLRYAEKFGAKTIQIGKNITNGYGTGGQPLLGEQAAQEDAPAIVKMSISEAFKEADSVLRQGIQLIFELIMTIGDINTDFADIKAMLRRSNKSDAILGIGESESGSVMEAVQKTINSPLFNRTLKGARAIIFNVTANENLELFAVNEAMDYLRKQTQNEETDIFFGTVVDNSMGDTVRTMLIASDFE